MSALWEELLAKLEQLAAALDAAALADPEANVVTWGQRVEGAWRELAHSVSDDFAADAFLVDNGTFGWTWSDREPPRLCSLYLLEYTTEDFNAEALVAKAMVRARLAAAWVRQRCEAARAALVPSLREVDPERELFEVNDAGRCECVELTGVDYLTLRALVDGQDAGGPDEDAMKKRRDRLLKKLPCLRLHVRTVDGKYVMSPAMRDRVIFLK